MVYGAALTLPGQFLAAQEPPAKQIVILYSFRRPFQFPAAADTTASAEASGFAGDLGRQVCLSQAGKPRLLLGAFV
jgi:hypothetical protein